MNRDATQAGIRHVPCPACGQPAVFAPGNRWRPFCSERCRLGDLGAWASERYRVPASAAPDTEADADADADAPPPVPPAG
ncbi:DNA gyrase inhibitor YacG [Aquabacterium sp. OR-4]|uniref:DNA gyrase inhibitor YacG n=1 Tax=Aquabacterium sp. OR-4 TaxID=2978127 RepID=UPI0021B41EA8|nr:DNA gyrase inhibitor YacG [Aquabacterium sp. OR-4]MDT7837341.1 DNA gyrase inhibitor YacG [Aquabacterium sp. OR-4]